MQASGKTIRYESLDFLRFLAFLSVFLTHTEPYHTITHNPFMAVSFFVILSGFLYGVRYQDSECPVTWKSEYAFCKKRIKKFYPIHLFTLMLCVPVYVSSLLTENISRAAAIKWGKVFLQNLFLVQSWFTKGYFRFNGVSWFLSLMIFLTVITLPLACFMKKIRSLKSGKLILTGLFFLCVAVSLGWGYLVWKKSLSMEYWAYIFPISRLPEYMAGMALGFVASGEYKPSKTFGTIAEAGILWICWELTIRYGWMGALPEWIQREGLWILPNAILILIFFHGGGLVSWLFGQKIFRWLGSLSFECFMLHLVIILYGNKVFQAEAMTSWMKHLVVVYYLFAAIAVSTVWKKAFRGYQAR